MAILKLLHLLAAMLWVGGMFFAHAILRPSAVEVLEPPQRLPLWNRVFHRFFIWVWGAVAVLLLSGFYMILLYGGFTGVPRHVHVMLALGLVMMAIYGHVYFGCYLKFRRLVSSQSWKEAGTMLGTIRKLVGVNIILGVLTVCVAVIGMNWA
jgi:uncharacterized membrane protein